MTTSPYVLHGGASNDNQNVCFHGEVKKKNLLSKAMYMLAKAFSLYTIEKMTKFDYTVDSRYLELAYLE